MRDYKTLAKMYPDADVALGVKIEPDKDNSPDDNVVSLQQTKYFAQKVQLLREKFRPTIVLTPTIVRETLGNPITTEHIQRNLEEIDDIRHELNENFRAKNIQSLCLAVLNQLKKAIHSAPPNKAPQLRVVGAP